jgi:hypothetical protein
MNRTLIEQPFAPSLIRQRKGSFGQTLDYIETHVVIQRLNDAFEGNWSYEIAEYTQLEDEAVVLGRLTAEGIVKQQFGSSKITRAKNGGESISIGDDLKSAASDALKKCATLMGIGLHLYGELGDSAATGTTTEARPKDGMNTMSGNKGNSRITKDQLSRIKKLRTDLGWTPDAVLDHVERLFGTRDVESLNSTMSSALIAYLANQPGNGGSK